MAGSYDDQQYELNILAFKVGQDCFGVEVKQILRLGMSSIEKVSRASNNMVQLRTKLIEDVVMFPTMDFNEMLGVTRPITRKEERSTIMVLKSDDGPMGITVDEIEGLYSLSPREVYPLPQRIRRFLTYGCIWGLGLTSDRLLFLIDSNNLPKIKNRTLVVSDNDQLRGKGVDS